MPRTNVRTTTPAFYRLEKRLADFFLARRQRVFRLLVLLLLSISGPGNLVNHPAGFATFAAFKTIEFSMTLRRDEATRRLRTDELQNHFA
jgi:hypothetical protein